MRCGGLNVANVCANYLHVQQLPSNIPIIWPPDKCNSNIQLTPQLVPKSVCVCYPVQGMYLIVGLKDISCLKQLLAVAGNKVD